MKGVTSFLKPGACGIWHADWQPPVPPMTDHATQKLTPREMVRAHAYPVLAAVSTVTRWPGNTDNAWHR